MKRTVNQSLLKCLNSIKTYQIKAFAFKLINWFAFIPFEYVRNINILSLQQLSMTTSFSNFVDFIFAIYRSRFDLPRQVYCIC